MVWGLLLLAGIEEVIATVSMKYLDGWKKKWPIIVIVVGFSLSFYCLSTAMQTLPAGIAYAVWTGIGTIGITLADLFWFKEKINKFQAFSLLFILIGVIGMSLTS